MPIGNPRIRVRNSTSSRRGRDDGANGDCQSASPSTNLTQAPSTKQHWLHFSSRSAHFDFDELFAGNVVQGNAVLDDSAIPFDLPNPALDALGIVDFDSPGRGPALDNDFATGPFGGNARLYAQAITRQTDAENRFDGDAIHPPRGACVPGPPAPAGMRRPAVNIGRDDVGFHTIGRWRVADRRSAGPD